MSKLLSPEDAGLYRIVYRAQLGHGSSVGIATAYGSDGPGIESRWRRDFPHLPRPALGPTQPPVLPLWAVRPVQSLSACTRVHFITSCSETRLQGQISYLLF